MKRIFKISLIAILCIVLWIATLLYLAPRFEEIPDFVFDLVLLLPLVVPALFGLYLLFCLIVGVKAFKTVPEEAEKLQKDIARWVFLRLSGRWPLLFTAAETYSDCNGTFTHMSVCRAKSALKAKGVSTSAKKDE